MKHYSRAVKAEVGIEARRFNITQVLIDKALTDFAQVRVHLSICRFKQHQLVLYDTPGAKSASRMLFSVMKTFMSMCVYRDNHLFCSRNVMKPVLSSIASTIARDSRW